MTFNVSLLNVIIDTVPVSVNTPQDTNIGWNCSLVRWNQTCTDEHMHRRVGTPGKIHDMYLCVYSASVMYMMIGIGSVGPTHWCTPFSRHV